VDNLEKPTTLITGASIGIGAATARAFADAGYRVIVTDILEGEGRSVAGDIESGGGEAEYRHLDVTNTDEVDAVVSTVQDRYGPLHTVVANAGIAHRVPLTELTDEKWDHTHDVDLKGVMRVCRAAAPAMRAAGRGSMIALSSIMGVAYGWDKHVQHSLGPEGLERAAEFIPMGRVGEPEDVADVSVFLASEEARYITGQVLVVDGGLLVGRY
jgi:3-oxoacyl-[acyl-carrier protein] reductase